MRSVHDMLEYEKKQVCDLRYRSICRKGNYQSQKFNVRQSTVHFASNFKLKIINQEFLISCQSVYINRP